MIPKIAFLFLIISEVFHENVWVNFFAHHESQYSLYVHVKKTMNNDSFFKPYQLQKRIPTTWANTMKAQIYLLQEALKDPLNEKFVFISESTIPLQPFDYVYTFLMRNELSEFDFYKNRFLNRNFGKYKGRDVLKNGQWIVLNRKHAQLMAQDKSIIKEFEQGGHDQEHYPSTFFAIHNLLNEVIKHETTLCIWGNSGAHPHEFQCLENDPFKEVLMKAIHNKKFLFARKFAKNCDIDELYLASSTKKDFNTL